MKQVVQLLDQVNEPLGFLLLTLLVLCAVWFSVRLRFAQFRLMPEMLGLLFESNKSGGTISSFQAFVVSLASRVGTGNLAGVATAIAVGGPGAIFWMWVMALLGSANALVESSLAQLFKCRLSDSPAKKNDFIGGPAYYISKGLGSRAFACVFAVSIIICFGFANNMVQANTITLAFTRAFSFSPLLMAVILTILSLATVLGGIRRIARVSSVIVPFMALAYVGVTVYIMVVNYHAIPDVLMLIVKNALGMEQFAGGTFGGMVVMGFKRGLFSNEAGEGSAPNAAATATTTHPVKQGLIQSLGVFTDTLLVCTCTAFIILSSGIFADGENGIELTQQALSVHVGAVGETIIAVCIFFFAFSSIIGNYYYGECNLHFLMPGKYPRLVYGVISGGILVFLGSMVALELVWGIVDFCMAIMASCNIVAILLLGKYVVRLLRDYESQRKAGKDPVYTSDTIPEISHLTECW